MTTRVERNRRVERGRVERKGGCDVNLLVGERDRLTRKRRVERDDVAFFRVDRESFAKRDESVGDIDDVGGCRDNGRSDFDLRLERVGATLTDRFSYELRTSAARLADLSPVNILARGYSITRDKNNRIVSSVDQAPVGSNIKVMVADGTLACEVVGHTLLQASLSG